MESQHIYNLLRLAFFTQCIDNSPEFSIIQVVAYVSGCCFLFIASSTPQYERTTFCLTIYLSKDIRVVSSLGLKSKAKTHS